MRATRKISKQKSDPWKAAEAFGCDMALLEENLRMKPDERLRAHQAALNLVEELQRGSPKHHVRS